MTRLTAPASARIALEWRKLEERAAVVRGRVEACPRAYQDGPMRSAENRIALRQMDKAREMLDAIDAKLVEYAETQEVADMAAAGEAQDRLLAERGIETFDTGTVKARDGWQWLITRKPPRLSHDEIEAGNAYAKLYAMALRDELSSSSNDNGGQGTEDPLEARIKNRQRLDAVRRHIVDATGSNRLVNLLDAVCGRGDTLRSLAKDDERRAAGYEVELKIALAMVAVGLKSVREAEKAKAA